MDGWLTIRQFIRFSAFSWDLSFCVLHTCKFYHHLISGDIHSLLAAWYLGACSTSWCFITSCFLWKISRQHSGLPGLLMALYLFSIFFGHSLEDWEQGIYSCPNVTPHDSKRKDGHDAMVWFKVNRKTMPETNIIVYIFSERLKLWFLWGFKLNIYE